MTYVEKRTREQVTVCQHLETKEKEWQKAIKDLKIKVDSLTKELEKSRNGSHMFTKMLFQIKLMQI